MKKKEKLHPTAFVVFGATGNLTQLKLYPALYELAERNELPAYFAIYGMAREDISENAFRKSIKDTIRAHSKVKPKKDVLESLLKRVKYISADLKDREGYDELEVQIKKEEEKLGHGILRTFYLALPPGIFPYVAKHVEACRLGKNLCTKEKVLSRIIVEKPFGSDLASAKKLEKRIREVFKDEQIFRIDHYLGKEAFQNILIFRFANRFFEEHWSRKHVEQIQINALETVGTTGRSLYYDGAGAVRDMVQSHLLQFLAYLMMDEPKRLDAKALQAAKLEVLKKVRPFGGKVSMVRGQYRGYRKEDGVKCGSKTETYVAMTLEINTPRWRGVPIHIRTGKALGSKNTSATVEFKHQKGIFSYAPKYPVKSNMVSIRLAPSPSVSMRVNVHKPGVDMGADTASMHYCRGEHFSEPESSAYARLLVDVMRGDRSIFTSAEEIFVAWTAVEPFMKDRQEPLPYKAGSRGPIDADILPGLHGNAWEDPIVNCPF